MRASVQYYMDKAIEDELRYAMRDKAKFHSDHEAYAILKDEWEQLELDLYAAIHTREEIWNCVKDEDESGVRENKKLMLKDVRELISKAVEIAGTLERFNVRGEKE